MAKYGYEVIPTSFQVDIINLDTNVVSDWSVDFTCEEEAVEWGELRVAQLFVEEKQNG